MTLTDIERDALKRDYPAHWFVRVVRDGWQVLLAIPKTAKGEIQMPHGGPMWPVDFLHGVTVKIG